MNIIRFEAFNFKSIKGNDYSNFDREIYGNEIEWTYVVAGMAKLKGDVYKKITLFNQNDFHNIFLEGQPLSPYIKMEGNSHIDMALGALETRNGTISGMKYDSNRGLNVCFVEAKYLSDLSGRTEHSLVRNQMDRVIENLLCLEDGGTFPEQFVFTLLTPRIFKENFGLRLYSYKYEEYNSLLKHNRDELARRIRVLCGSSDKRFKFLENDKLFSKKLDSFKLNWVTYEEILEIFSPQYHSLDISSKEDAREIWNSESMCDLLTSLKNEMAN